MRAAPQQRSSVTPPPQQGNECPLVGLGRWTQAAKRISGRTSMLADGGAA